MQRRARSLLHVCNDGHRAYCTFGTYGGMYGTEPGPLGLGPVVEGIGAPRMAPDGKPQTRGVRPEYPVPTQYIPMVQHVMTGGARG